MYLIKIPGTAGWGLLDEDLLSSASNRLEQLFLFGQLLLQFLTSKHVRQLDWTLYDIIFIVVFIIKLHHYLFFSIIV